MLISEKALKDFCQMILENIGCKKIEASQIATVLIEANLRGIHSHGVARIKRYLDHISNGTIEINKEPELIYETKNSMVIDGKNGSGQHVSNNAVEKIKDKRKNENIVFCAVRNSNHFGIAGYYAELLASTDSIGIALTNTAPLVVPTFAKEPVLGTNPIAIATPLENNTFLLDMATSVIPRGKLEVYDRIQKEIPLGWAINENAEETTSPSLALSSLSEKKGGILPLGGLGEMFGGHKGFGLTLLVDLLTAGLSQGDFSKNTYKNKGKICHFFASIDLKIFGDVQMIKKHLSQIVESVCNSQKAEGREKIYFHGEKESLEKQNSRERGIELDQKTVNMLDDIAEFYQLEKLDWRK